MVYLDADTIVVKNIEDLFKCGKFCANLKHSERLNSGVMVVEPSKEVFNDMMSKVNTLHSYTGGMLDSCIHSIAMPYLSTLLKKITGGCVLCFSQCNVWMISCNLIILICYCTYHLVSSILGNEVTILYLFV